jgi:hypothetical protein
MLHTSWQLIINIFICQKLCQLWKSLAIAHGENVSISSVDLKIESRELWYQIAVVPL